MDYTENDQWNGCTKEVEEHQQQKRKEELQKTQKQTEKSQTRPRKSSLKACMMRSWNFI